MTRYSAAFVDRDGTVIHEGPYLSDPAAVELLPNAASAIALLNERDIPVVIITNQSGIGRGLYTAAAFRTVQAELEAQLEASDARVDAVYHCPHDPGRITCRCRKPGTALFERASQDLGGLSLPNALYIGDQMRDVLPGLELGGRALLLRSEAASGGATPTRCERASDLYEAVRLALALSPETTS
jgi:D-glycero-D-manno-heptose 1,7-bisphosphate phosphatase